VVALSGLDLCVAMRGWSASPGTHGIRIVFGPSQGCLLACQARMAIARQPGSSVVVTTGQGRLAAPVAPTALGATAGTRNAPLSLLLLARRPLHCLRRQSQDPTENVQPHGGNAVVWSGRAPPAASRGMSAPHKTSGTRSAHPSRWWPTARARESGSNVAAGTGQGPRAACRGFRARPSTSGIGSAFGGNLSPA